MLDIYQNERLLKSRAYLVTQISPNIFNLFNVIEKQLHRTKRRIVGQGLNERAIKQFEPTMVKQINIFLRKLLRASETQSPVDMSNFCNLLGYDVSIELGFGRSLDFQTNASNYWMVQGIQMSNWRLNLYIQYPALRNLDKFLMPVFLPRILKYHRAVKTMIQTRQSEPKHARADLFSSVSEYKDPETGASLSPREIWSEATFLIPAGGDTTATAMAALFFYLSRSPNHYTRLAHEIRSTFTHASEITSGPKLSACTYLRACLDEILRLTPPAGTTLWRTVPADANTHPVIIDGHAVPPGTQVGVNIHSMHHNEAYFRDPFTFAPERWLEVESGLAERERGVMYDAFVPFSVGARSCAGRALAYLEPSVVVARTLWYFDFRGVGAGLESGGREGAEGGEVFRVEDVFGSRHTGPLLVFTARDGLGRRSSGFVGRGVLVWCVGLLF